MPDVRNHYPVLLSEIISIITPQYGGTFIDSPIAPNDDLHVGRLDGREHVRRDRDPEEFHLRDAEEENLRGGGAAGRPRQRRAEGQSQQLVLRRREPHVIAQTWRRRSARRDRSAAP